MTHHSNAEAKLVELGITLPPPAGGSKTRVAAVRTGNLVFLSGHGPAAGPDGTVASGKVGGKYTQEQGYEQARLTGLNLLRSLRDEVESLDRVTRIVKVLGMVNCQPGFSKTSAVVDGASDLFVEVFGPEIGRHARSAVGMAELPLDFPVEIELIAEVE